MLNLLIAIISSLVLVSCNPSEEQRAAKQYVELPSSKAGDRPSEEGVGIPGYLSCSLKSKYENQADVACQVYDDKDQRLTLPEKSWQDFDIMISEKYRDSVTVEKLAPSSSQEDVIFRLTSENSVDLARVAKYASYSYLTGTLTQALEEPLEEPTEEPNQEPPSARTCSDGVEINGRCFIVTELSCSEACNQKSSNTDLAAMQALSKDECRTIYEALSPQSLLLGMRDRSILVNGYGCYASGRGSVIYESGSIDLDKYPPLIGSRSCACQ